MQNLPIFLQKIITLAFAFLVFITVLLLSSSHRQILTHVGMILMITVVYVEILMVRDHLWLIEGSLGETRRWRDAFFSRQSMRQQRIRKLLAVVLATVIFTFVFMYTKSETELFSFLGTVLMITVLYFEVLTIRDEVFSLSSSLKARDIAEAAKKEAAGQDGSATDGVTETSSENTRIPVPDSQKKD